MHNRTGPVVTGREMRLTDGLVIVPLTLAIVAFALYPQQALENGEPAVKASVRPALEAASPAVRIASEGSTP
jgi:NADH-quinone oxidoreductase subunit M